MSLKFDCSRVRKTNLIVIFCTLLLVCFKFCLSYEERKGSCGNVVVQRGRNKPGFHRDLTTYVEWTVSGSSHSDLQDCQLLLVEYFPSGVYVDPDQIKNEEEFGGPEVLITEAINTEVMAHHSSPHKVFLFPKAVVNSRLGSIYVNISIPIHLRYHKAAKKEKFVPVSLSPPTILGKCNHGMDNFATWCAGEMIKAPCSARKSSRYCNWITLTQVNEENLLVFQVPVGQTEHTLLITILTVFSAIAGSSLLVWNSSLSSC
ncbi:unnamed protein product [Porites lobata]|uniref:Phosphatidylinositol-glycan biosynthesis class X protein n=1 Tax=Porites lobata TaxID=104759 RepID=A0ABN8N081_9CNID|nr:unnamed protein product [Porites lobata]